jgi:hypothetical protein
MGRFIQSSATATLQPVYKEDDHIYEYDQNSCWQNKVVIERPGSYTFTVPTGVNCMRVIAVGGGGKACYSRNCCNHAGAGGGYVERIDTVAPGCAVNIVVGRQQQDTTIAYTCSGGGAVTVTGGGAAACTPGAASGGNIRNSTGGRAGGGYNCQNDVGTCPSTCLCMYATDCCGYCIVYGCNCITHVQEEFCTSYYPGGGSAGSFIHPIGGNGQDVCHKRAWLYNNTGGPAAGGGGGIGYVCRCFAITAWCNCICVNYGTGNTFQVCAPAVAGGGGGTRYVECVSNCDMQLWNGLCQNGIWREGSGGWGAPDRQEGRGGALWWSCIVCNQSGNSMKEFCCSVPPRRYKWHDIYDIQGSGSAGKSIAGCGFCSWQGNKWIKGSNWGGPPQDAGEGAGTGGAVYICCRMCDVDWPHIPDTIGVCWTMACDLGTTGRYDQAWNCETARQLIPGFISYAGTLGGAGGIGVFGFASKAGKGGGAGMYKCFIHCVCWGGNYDYCNNNNANPLLAFPPCLLDMLVSGAGTGMAVIYWKDES